MKVLLYLAVSFAVTVLVRSEACHFGDISDCHATLCAPGYSLVCRLGQCGCANHALGECTVYADCSGHCAHLWHCISGHCQCGFGSDVVGK